jgi:hypothetical protein
LAVAFGSCQAADEANRHATEANQHAAQANRNASVANQIAADEAAARLDVEGPAEQPVANTHLCLTPAGEHQILTVNFEISLTNTGGRNASLTRIDVDPDPTSWVVIESYERLSFAEAILDPPDVLPHDLDAGRTREMWLLAVSISSLDASSPARTSETVASPLHLVFRLGDDSTQPLSVPFQRSALIASGGIECEVLESIQSDITAQ